MNTYRAKLRATLAPPRRPIAIFTAWAALMGSAQATQPPDVVASDGSGNTAMGTNALATNDANAGGTYNTAGGEYALYLNYSGTENTAFGYQALADNQIGDSNTAFGVNALVGNTKGGANTAVGVGALESNLGGLDNTAVGYNAAFSTQENVGNTAFGANALLDATGGQNIAIGMGAGQNLTSGSYNIMIGSQGNSGDVSVIRVGTPGQQSQTFIAGISGSKVTGAAVYVTSSGQLGVLASSERYKTAITPMGSRTVRLQSLRPVTFHLKSDPKGALQYGLIAEEVAKVYPELVIRDEKGRIEGVRYDELAPMLLNEFQKQQVTIEALVAKNEQQSAELREVRAQLTELNQLRESMQEALSQLPAKHERIAMR